MKANIYELKRQIMAKKINLLHYLQFYVQTRLLFALQNLFIQLTLGLTTGTPPPQGFYPIFVNGISSCSLILPRETFFLKRGDTRLLW